MGEPAADLGGETCEWCGERATVATEIKRKIKGQRGGVVGTGSFIYTCAKHEAQAQAVVTAKVLPGT